MERRALVLTTLRPDAAAVELDELLADRQPETRASGAAGDRVIELLERLEEPRQVVLANSDAGVGDAQPDGVRLGDDADQHAALRGELDRIRQQIEQDLLDLRPVGRQRRQLERHVLLDLQLLAAGERGRRLDALVDQLVQIDLLGQHLELARLDTREVEDPVDELQEVGAAVVDRADVGLLPLGQLAVETVEQHLREADDRVERRPELVRHAGQELRLQPARLHELGVRVRELFVEPRVLQRDGDLVGEHREHLELLVVEDVARELLADQEDSGQLALDLQRHDQGRLDRVELVLGRLEVDRDLRIELRLFLDQHPALPVQPLYDRAIDADRRNAGALADGRVLAVDDERAALGIEDHQDAVSQRHAAHEAVHERLHQTAEVEDRAHALAEVQQGLVAAPATAEHQALDALLEPLADGAHQHGQDEAQRQDDPERIHLIPVGERLSGHERPGEHAPQQQVDRALLHQYVHVEESVADDRRAEHQGEDHVGRDAHGVHEIRRRHEAREDEPGEVDDAADQAHAGAEQNEGRAVPPEARIDALVYADQVKQSVDEEEIEVGEERRVERAGRGRPAPVRRFHAAHKERRSAQVDHAEHDRQQVRDGQRDAVARRALEEDQDEVVVERRERDDPGVDHDLPEDCGRLVRRAAQHEHAEVPDGHAADEVREQAVEPAPG